MLELLKKERSFYYPYLRCLPKDDFTALEWHQSSVDACSSIYISEWRDETAGSLLHRYNLTKDILNKEELFTQFAQSEEELRAIFLYACYNVMTRSFSWMQPSTCIVPLADMFNVDNEWTCSHFIVHREHELKPKEKPSEYNLKSGQLNLELLGIPPPQEVFEKLTNRQKYLKWMQQNGLATDKISLE
jgi:hypothetical protein